MISLASRQVITRLAPNCHMPENHLLLATSIMPSQKNTKHETSYSTSHWKFMLSSKIWVLTSQDWDLWILPERLASFCYSPNVAIPTRVTRGHYNDVSVCLSPTFHKPVTELTMCIVSCKSCNWNRWVSGFCRHPWFAPFRGNPNVSRAVGVDFHQQALK